MMRTKSALRCIVWTTVALACSAATVWANVYPAGLLVDTSAAGGTCGTVKITYFLNEDANGTSTLPGVKIEVLDNTSAVIRTFIFPSQTKGLHTWEWDGRNSSGARVANGSYSFRITSADFGHPGWTLISSDSNTLMQFERPNGIAVNRNIDPVTRVASQYYGRIYVSNPRTTSTASGRTMGDGIYVLNPDQTDALGQG